ncbi:barstar family protein [Mucilaginibacter sabulilitoris]|uniref:barstar family protein n=1 Tax=Mucilaginibacter sabulilitoris TaxID=1173583 RepID=UPI0038991E28
MEIIIDGERIRNIEDFHLEIKEKLKFPEYYGENMNALWDCLTSSIELPVTLIWKNVNISKASLGEDFNSIVDLFFRPRRKSMVLVSNIFNHE